MFKNSIFFKNKLVLVPVFLIIAALMGIFIFGSLIKLKNNQSEINVPKGNVEESGSEVANYPPNLLEGEIIAINAANKTITIRARLSKIVPGLAEAERIIKIAGAEIVVYNIDTQKEVSATLGELEVGNGVLLATEESNLDETATRQQYTAVKITKMIKNSNVQ